VVVNNFGYNPRHFLISLFLLLLIAAGSRKKRLSNREVGLLALALALALFFKPAVAPVGMWKSGGGWANRWAGGSLPVHRFAHALEPALRHGSIVPDFHISTGRNSRRQGCRRMGRRRKVGSF
jgi:hypothetical protein